MGSLDGISQSAGPIETFARFQAGFLSSGDFHRFLDICVDFHLFSQILIGFMHFVAFHRFYGFSEIFIDFHAFRGMGAQDLAPPLRFDLLPL